MHNNEKWLNLLINYLLTYALSVKILLSPTKNPASVFPKMSGCRMIDKAVRVSRRLCKILSREITKCGGMATWYQVSGRVRRDVSRLSIGERGDAVRDAGAIRGWGRLRRNQGRGYGRWNNPYLRAPVFSNSPFPASVFPPGMLPAVSLADLVEAGRSRCCQRRSCCRG